MNRPITWLVLLTMVIGLAFLASPASAQAPTAIIKIEGYSPQEIHDLGWTSPRSTGLPVVGVGQVVYLLGRDSLNAAVTSYAWSFTARPAGSTAALDSTNKRQTTFKPDMVGKFTVQLVLTTAGGTSAPRTSTITSSKFVGVGGMDSLPTNPAEGQCSLCHSANFAAWSKTAHSTFFKRAIDGQASPSYNESCIECHNTGFDDSPAAVNDGFDDVARETGWVFPAVLQPGNYANLLATNPRLAARANIQCESCHGPASQHKGDKTSIAMRLEEATCGYCHEEEPYHRIDTQWKESGHAVESAEATNASCARCHSGWGFIRRVDPKNPDTRPALGFGQVSCAVCHDPHRSELLPNQVRTLDNVTLGDSVTVVDYGGMGKICMQCHISRRDAEDYVNSVANLSTRFGPHHSNQADMLDGSNSIDYGVPIGSSGHKFATADACVTCHMGATPAEGQPGHDIVGEHTFAVRTDNGTPTDPSDDVQNVAVCQSCHGPITSFDDIMAKADYDEDGAIEGTRHEVEGLLHRLDQLLPPRTSNAVIKANYDWTLPGLSQSEIEQRHAYTKAWYNLLFVEEDGSGGVHNAGYAIALLRRSIATLTTGDIGAGDIVSIKDVAEDQGKQVRIMWSKFAADGPASTNPVTSYSIWRRVDDAGATAGVKLSSRAEMFAAGVLNNVGKRYTVNQAGTWDFVGWLPASGYEAYSTVAPTLYDSTTAGVHWSVFFISGQAHSVTYETAPDSGFSVDNLAPAPPNNISASYVASTVRLRWDESVDKDFKYFAIYRGTTPGFDPKGAPPLATSSETEYTDSQVSGGSAYYYRLSAYDFAGNESIYSSEVGVITRVEERGSGTPTEYALEQNYPNPFNPETTIKYQLPQPGHVRLVVFDALGHQVRELVDRDQAAAYHLIVWDGRDQAGHVVPSGLYFYRLESEKFSTMKKMIMMK